MSRPLVNPSAGYMTLVRLLRERRRPSTSTSRRWERAMSRGVCPSGTADSPSDMDPKTLVLQYLDEAHATETALVTNLRAHLTMTTEDSYRKLIERHLKETQDQVKNIDKRRSELGSDGGRSLVAGAVGL